MWDGTTMLHGAVGMNRVDCVRALLRHGAEVGVRVQRGQTPLHEATFYWWDNAAMVSVLLQAGAKDDAKDANGMTALGYAVDKGHEACADLLRKSGAKGG